VACFGVQSGHSLEEFEENHKIIDHV